MMIPMTERKKTITFALSETNIERVKELAREDNRTVSQWVGKVIMDKLKEGDGDTGK
jgi:phosphoenolpyruvate carboxylase